MGVNRASKRLSISTIDYMDLVNSDGMGLTIYFKGCSRGCPGCHNKELQAFGEPNYSIIDILNKIEPYKNYYDYIIFLGGEPLEQDLSDLMREINDIGCPIIVYTGFSREEVPNYVYKYADKIKVGEYIQELQDKNYNLASTNQKFLIKGEDF